MLKTVLVRHVTALCVLFLCVTSAFAQTNQTVVHANNRINVAGLYMMLSQRMAAATCLLIANVDVERRRNIADSSWQELDWFLEMLEYGDDSEEFPPQTSPDVLDAIHRVTANWEELKTPLFQIIAGDLHPVIVRQFIARNEQLMDNTDRLVEVLVDDFSGSNMDLAVVKSVELSGRNRSLVKQMLNTYCLATVGVDRPENLEALSANTVKFRRTLNRLRTTGVQSPELNEQITYISTLWQKLETDYGELSLESGYDPELLLDLARQSDELLMETDSLVNLLVEQ